MPRPIRITDAMKQKAQDEFAEHLLDLKMTDGQIHFYKSYQYDPKTTGAILWFTPLAYRKTVALVTAFDDEVAWHGMAVRSNEVMNEFIVEDIAVYPQEVTGSTVVTDQEEYTKWLYAFDDGDFNKIRMQGHSHVNMGVSPSGVDNGHRAKILEQLDPDMFYIFMVWNKQLKTHTLIFDMKHNVLYEDEDVEVKIFGDDSIEAFLGEAGGMVRRREPVPRILRAKGGKRMKEIKEEQRSLWDTYYGSGIHDPDDWGGYEWTS